MDGKGNALSIFFVGNLSFFTILNTSDHSEDAGQMIFASRLADYKAL